MAKIVSYNGKVQLGTVAATSGDVSDHCKMFKVNQGQESKEVTCHGNTQRVFRAGLSNVSVDLTFVADHASGQINDILRSQISTTSTGFTAAFRQVNTVVSTTNQMWTGEWVIDGDVPQLNESVGEVPEITVRLVPYDTITVQTSATS
jgi:hypothetical protein